MTNSQEVTLLLHHHHYGQNADLSPAPPDIFPSSKNFSPLKLLFSKGNCITQDLLSECGWSPIYDTERRKAGENADIAGRKIRVLHSRSPKCSGGRKFATPLASLWCQSWVLAASLPHQSPWSAAWETSWMARQLQQLCVYTCSGWRTHNLRSQLAESLSALIHLPQQPVPPIRVLSNASFFNSYRLLRICPTSPMPHNKVSSPSLVPGLNLFPNYGFLDSVGSELLFLQESWELSSNITEELMLAKAAVAAFSVSRSVFVVVPWT